MRNFTDLTGKKAIVTGAAQGLCHGMAEGLMEAGAEVCIIDINPGTLETAAAFTDRGFTCHGVIADLGSDESLNEGFAKALAPGYMDTEMNVALTDPSNPRYKEITDRIPAHAWGTAEDMKGPCVFLASGASDYLSGAVIPVDGGYLVR